MNRTRKRRSSRLSGLFNRNGNTNYCVREHHEHRATFVMCSRDFVDPALHALNSRFFDSFFPESCMMRESSRAWAELDSVEGGSACQRAIGWKQSDTMSDMRSVDCARALDS